jgi:hypothetical protein
MSKKYTVSGFDFYGPNRLFVKFKFESQSVKVVFHFCRIKKKENFFVLFMKPLSASPTHLKILVLLFGGKVMADSIDFFRFFGFNIASVRVCIVQKASSCSAFDE